MTKNRLEYADADEMFYDFCLWEYAPIAPHVGKLRPSSLLLHSFETAGMDERVFRFVGAIRSGFGVSKTVWGIKNLGDRIAWEFYFYDYRLTQRERSVAEFLEIIRPFAACDVPFDDNLPYFMFSVDVDERLVTGSRDLDEIHAYLGNAGSTVSSGIAYSMKREGTRLENLYFFFDAETQMEQIVRKASCSAHLGGGSIDIDLVLWPELRDCGVIVVANKQGHDGVYFSRINIDQLILFLERMGYPEEMRGFVETHRAELDHLLYDVGFDYHVKGGDLVILKSGYYGTF